jgi:hypothetical protein
MKEKIIFILIYVAAIALIIFMSMTITKAICGSDMQDWLKVWIIAG